MATQIVLVPGFWLGAWAWDEVAAELADRGHAVTAVTLPGLHPDGTDGPVGPAPGKVTLDHVHAISSALDGRQNVGCSWCTAALSCRGTMVLDRHPDLVDHVVFVDTAPVRDGFVMNEGLEGDEYPLSAAWEAEMADGSMRGLTQEQLDTFRQRAVPQQAGTVRGRVTLTDPRRLEVPGTVVCTAFTSEEYLQLRRTGSAVPCRTARPHRPRPRRPAHGTLADVVAACRSCRDHRRDGEPGLRAGWSVSPAAQ